MLRSIFAIFVLYCVVTGAIAQDNEVIVYTAKKIITMDPDNPEATAVAVRGKRIVSVGSLESLKPWLDVHPHKINDTFKKKIIMPGLIDPHLHPLLGALQFGMTWITPEAWTLHDAEIPAAKNQKEYRQLLRDAIRASKGDDKPIFLTWGWNEADHGPMTRDILDSIEKKKPVMVWQRSIHEAVYNTAALKYMKITEADTKEYSKTEANWETGHFLEAGFFELAILRLAPYLMTPDFMDSGYRRVQEYLMANGVTTVGDLATGLMDWELELNALTRNYVSKNAPLRSVLVPAAQALSLSKGGLDKSFSFVDEQLANKDAPSQIVYGKRIKLLADGAMFSQLMQVFPPGYIDGHHGEWITPKIDFEAQARKYWQAGYRIHVHANGDKGISYTLDVFEKLQKEMPRLPGALVIEHFGFANDSLNKRIAALGASVSANPYYLTALGDSYSVNGLGTDRAMRITSLSGLLDRNVTVALHSDFGMAPASPLFLAWSAITRQTLSGKKFTPPRGLTREQALRAITVDAASILGLEHDLGSIQSGKLADFTILESDPKKVSIKKLKNMPIWGVVFEGDVHKAQ